MSWRTRRHDEYTNHGKVTKTTIKPSTSSDFYRVFQTQRYIGAQEQPTFEGVFPQDEAEEAFAMLVAEAHAEQVEPPKNGKVVASIVDADV